MTNRLKVVDLFAGAGGLSLGFEQTEMFETKAAVEINLYAIQTYMKNRGGVKVYNDVTKLDYEELSNKFGQIDVVIGGPPCQGFSNANRQKNSLISGNNSLVKEFIKAIKHLTPKAFVMENVKTITSDTHKFFLSSDMENELDDLNITTEIEYLSLGKIPRFIDELKRFVQVQEVLSQFILRKDVMSKLNSLYRVRSSYQNMNNYMQKNINVFKKFIDEWRRIHVLWGRDYMELWDSLGVEISESITNGQISSKLIDNIESIIQIQKVISKISELKANSIIYSFMNTGDECTVEVKTYKVFDYVIAKLRSMHYAVDFEVLSAANFGVPQHRERCFVIGIRKTVDSPEPKISFPKGFLTEGEYYTIEEAIQDLEDIEPSKTVVSGKINLSNIPTNPLQRLLRSKGNELYNHITTDTRPTAMERFKLLDQGQSFQDLDEDKKSNYTDPKRTQKTVYLRLEYAKPSRTVVNVRKSMWIHPTKNRAVSIREAARLQSFPDDYRFMGSKDSQYQQIGNAVPPLLGRAIAEQVLSLLGNPVNSSIVNILKREV
ncbi:hypothetical protein CBW65_22550 [Tumebacillus avium]|uniref:DNA (cytosine-5-)-methyltransferase n=1 Tax=Tumebacillus avium TaxID=1903704 RepID=A0A1Y0IS76_9BACL|nr:DNA cytosine methyltransferase [Tumebacillus avium]ARU63468.1 hypothetical protein CBW65_22550 [Tumebacillus avium]